MAIRIQDTFVGAAGPLVGRVADLPAYPWISVSGVIDHLVLDGAGNVSGTNTGSANSLCLAPGRPSTADYDVITKIKMGSPINGMSAGVAGRIAVSAGALTAYVARYNGGGQWEIYRFVAGAATLVGSPYVQALTPGVEYTMTLRMTGTTIKLFIDGVERISGTDSGITAAGRCGFFWNSGGNLNMSFSEFSMDGAALLPPPIIEDSFVGATVPLAGKLAVAPVAAWASVANVPDVLYIDGDGKAKGTSTGGFNSICAAPGSPLTADYDVSCKVTFGSPIEGMAVGIAGRIDVTAAGLTAYVARYNGGQWEIYRFSASSGTVMVGSAYVPPPLTLGQEYKMTLRMTGTTIKLFIDDVERISGTDSILTAAGKAGVYWFAGLNDNITINEFEVDGTGLAFEAPQLSQTGGDPGSVTLNISNPIGGTGPYTYALHRSASPNFTAGPGNLLASGAAFPYTDSTPIDGRGVYKVVVTDAAAATVTSKETISERWGEPLNVLFIGDSITAQLGAATEAVAYLSRAGQPREVSAIVRGVNGAVSSGWISGSANLTNALYEAGVAWGTGFIVSVCIGINDCHQTSLVSAATFQANILSMLSAIDAAGGIAVLNMPLCPAVGVYNGNLYTAASIARLVSYEAVLNNLCRSNKVRRGDRLAFGYFAKSPVKLRDGLHPTDAEYKVLGRFWGEAIAAAVRPQYVISGGSVIGI